MRSRRCSGGWRPAVLPCAARRKRLQRVAVERELDRRRSSAASPCPSRSRGTRGSSCACSASSRAGGSWKTQSFFAYISHCFGFGAPRRCCVPSVPRQPMRKPMPGCGLVVDDEVGIVLELALAVRRGEGRQLQARRQLDQHLLERLALARAAARPARAPNRPGRRTRRSAGRACSSRRGARGRWCRAARGRRRRPSRSGTRRRRRGTGSVTRRRRPCAFSISRTAIVFMVEFQAMLAMKISSVSSRYGSPRVALVITVCIRPCADSGCSQENAWSMRIGVPSSSIASSSGLAGKPSGAALSGVFGLIMSGELKARKFGTMWRGYGALWRKPPGASIVPSTLISTASARTVWKPFECAARPRIAWKATGRACVVACCLPQASVQAIGSSNACSQRGRRRARARAWRCAPPGCR